MTEYTPIEPQHYRDNPPGIELECIEYIEHLPYSQGTAGKYCYRLGNKDELTQDLNKTLWYVRRAMSKNMVEDLFLIKPELEPTIDPFLTFRSELFYRIVTGNLGVAEKMLEWRLEHEFPLDLQE